MNKSQNKLFFSILVSSLLLSSCDLLKIHEHTWGDIEYEWSSDNSICYAIRYCLEDIEHVESEMAYSSYSVLTEADCETDGLGIYTANFENQAFKTQKKEIVLPKINHKWINQTYTWNEDYSQCVALAICEHNNTHTFTETVDSTYEVIKEATYNEDGIGRYIATFSSDIFETQKKEISIPMKIYKGEIPRIDYDNFLVTYGLYPKSHVSDNKIIDELEKIQEPFDNGYYLYNGDYYVPEYSKPSWNKYLFDDGTLIPYANSLKGEEPQKLWFKCEPIEWDILESNDEGEYLLLSKNLVDVGYFNEHVTDTFINDHHKYVKEEAWNKGETIFADDYEKSDIRNWLNNDFYNKAFMLDDSYVELSDVDNSLATVWIPAAHKWVVNDTKDKVFLPSYMDLQNEAYGFSSRNTNTGRVNKKAYTTDYIRVKHIPLTYTPNNPNSQYSYYLEYFTRSKYPDASYSEVNQSYYESDERKVSGITYDASETGLISNKLAGIRPVIKIKIH